MKYLIFIALSLILVGADQAPKSVPPQATINNEVDTLLQGMTPYNKAKFTQEIAVTNDRDRITPVPRTKLEAKWQISGGFEDHLASGKVTSQQYKNDIASKPKVWVGDISVKNSLGYFQDNRGWKRQYSDGSKFLDVLSIDGNIFEIRQRVKVNGDWKSTIEYSNDFKPKDYRKGLSCSSCHDEAGTGGYASGLVPGGDGVLSDPFPALEKE